MNDSNAFSAYYISIGLRIEEEGFFLHTLTNLTEVVLDLRDTSTGAIKCRNLSVGVFKAVVESLRECHEKICSVHSSLKLVTSYRHF